MTKDERLAAQKKWKKMVEYGKRWLVEIAFSSIKRLLGEKVSAVKWENIVREIAAKIALYNRIIDLTEEAIAEVA